MRPLATLRKPAILSRRVLSLIVRGVAITSMAFAVAFGFLAGATSPAAHYDPYMFAIGVAALFGASCGTIGHPDFPHPPDEDRAARSRGAARRRGGSQLGNTRSAGAHLELLRGAGRRHRAPRRQRRDHLRQRRVLRACRPPARGPCWRPRLRCRLRSRANPAVSPTARRCTTRKSPRPTAHAGSPGAKSPCAPTAAAKCRASAAT